MVKRLLLFFAVSLLILSCESLTPEQRASLDRGKEIYISHCMSCHGTKGDGLQGAYPGLQKPEINEYHNKRTVNLIKVGSSFESGMKPIALSDDEIADVVNYINNSWGNESEFLSKQEIQNL